MSWLEKCEAALISSHIFLSHQHLSRFEYAIQILKQQAFTNKGLCKCAFVASYDQEHFDIFMDMIHKMVQEQDSNLDRMIEAGKEHIERTKGSEQTIYALALEFLLHPDETPSESFILELSSSWVPIGDSTLEASYIIDKL